MRASIVEAHPDSETQHKLVLKKLDLPKYTIIFSYCQRCAAPSLTRNLKSMLHGNIFIMFDNMTETGPFYALSNTYAPV